MSFSVPATIQAAPYSDEPEAIERAPVFPALVFDEMFAGKPEWIGGYAIGGWSTPCEPKGFGIETRLKTFYLVNVKGEKRQRVIIREEVCQSRF